MITSTHKSSLECFFVAADYITDYIPVVSTVTNLTYLFLKCAFIPFSGNKSINNKKYYTHLKDKSILRCVTLLIPVLGNLIVNFYDSAIQDANERMLKKIKHDPSAILSVLPASRDLILASININPFVLQFISQQFQDDKELVLTAVSRNGGSLFFASPRLRDDRDVALAAMKRSPRLVLKFVNERFKDDSDFMLEVIKYGADGLNGIVEAIKSTSERLRNDSDFMLAAIKRTDESMIALATEQGHNHRDWTNAALALASEELWDNREFILSVINQSQYYGKFATSAVLKFASKQIKDDTDFMLAAIQKDPLAVGEASERLRNDTDFMLVAIQKNPSALAWASERSRDNETLVLAAINKDQEKIVWASPRLQVKYKHVLAEHVKRNGHLIRQYASFFCDDQDVILAATKSYDKAPQYASSRLKADSAFMRAAIKRTHWGSSWNL